MTDLTTRQRLEADLKTAMRAGDTTTRDALRYLLSAVKNAEIDARGTGAAADADAALRKVAKQLADAIEQFRAAGRDDLADRESAQLDVLKRYLPPEMSEEDLRAAIAAAIAEVGATGPKDMGRVMPVALAKTAGQADGRRVSGAVKDALSRL
ncbi:MAG: GatB/YqeY domain-containing protein [Thermomicrobiales bacterium]|nr:GatB/YqeY domain-containing protein [Thermomicrobiales bacterium]